MDGVTNLYLAIMFVAAVLVVVGVLFVIRRPKPKERNRYTTLGLLLGFVWGLFFGSLFEEFFAFGAVIGFVLSIAIGGIAGMLADRRTSS
jgi:uncharacterized membrane protein